MVNSVISMHGNGESYFHGDGKLPGMVTRSKSVLVKSRSPILHGYQCHSIVVKGGRGAIVTPSPSTYLLDIVLFWTQSVSRNSTNKDLLFVSRLSEICYPVQSGLVCQINLIVSSKTAVVTTEQCITSLRCQM